MPDGGWAATGLNQRVANSSYYASVSSVQIGYLRKIIYNEFIVIEKIKRAHINSRQLNYVKKLSESEDKDQKQWSKLVVKRSRILKGR